MLLSIPVLLAAGMTTMRAQSALDGFDPNADFLVRVVVAQPDGKILIGGEFTSFSPNGGAPVTRNHIARLNVDGSIDAAFNPDANGVVWSIVLQADGKILVGGEFSGPNSIGGQERNFIARLDPTNGLADSFDPNADDVVYAITVQSDGRILAGGEFTGIGGATRNHIARLDAATGAADSFDPDAGGGGGFFSASVLAIVVQADGKILAGGQFTSIGGQTRNRIARLDPTTGAADAFDPDASAFIGGSVNAIVVQPDGRILAGGAFTSIGGQPRGSIARLDAATGAADAFDPNADNTVYAIAVQTDGKVLAGGSFNNVGGVTRNFMARLDPITGAPDAFNPDASGDVNSIAIQPDGKIVAGGVFTTLGATNRNFVARLETDGRLDQALDLGNPAPSSVILYATAVQPDGKILVGGFFDKVLNAPRTNIARLNPDGTLDGTFNPNANNAVLAIVVQADGKVLTGGQFTSMGGQTRNRIARLNPDGTLDTAFNPNANGSVFSIAVQPDGKILAGGAFLSLGGQTRNNIARLDATNGLADAFNPSANGSVNSIAVQADGRILAGGNFTGIGGQTRNRIARLDATNGLADSFNPNASNTVISITLQADGKILVGGAFTGIGGAPRNRLARLDATSGLADSFNPSAGGNVNSIAVQADGRILAGGNFVTLAPNGGGAVTRNRMARLNPDGTLDLAFNPNASNTVNSIAVQADGRILAGGNFTGIGGQPRFGFARLSNDTGALQNLAVTQTTISWTRGGSSPLFTRVTFEHSTNNASYTLLGSGTLVGSNWTLTGLSLLTGQNTYIRGRGYYSCGNQNGSGSIQESVRNVFLPTPLSPRLTIQRSGNTNVVLFWPTNAAGFTLEAKTNLNTNVWSVVSPLPAISSTNNVVTNTATGPARFYRLRQ